MIGIKFEKVLRSLVLTMHKMSGYAKTFKVKGGYKDKNNKINYSFHKDDEKLLETYKAIWTRQTLKILN